MQLARRVRTIATLSGALFLGSLALVPAALAGEIKFGEGLDSLATDDNGKLTDEGKATVLTELDSIPGEDAWDMNRWARLDSGAAEGPLYIEFWQRIDTDLDGKPDQDSLAYRHEDRNFDGSRYYLKNVVLEENFGFNKDRTYKVKIVQVSSSGRDIKLAEGKLRLLRLGVVDGDGEHESDDRDKQQLEKQRSDERHPAFVGDLCQPEHAHEKRVGRHDHVHEAVSHLVGQHRDLAADADDIRDRRHDRHGDIGLAGTRWHEEVQYALDEQHPDG